MKILLVEDDESIGLVLVQVLSEQYSVTIATDGEQALDLAKRFEFDLILLDVIIPKLDGINVCRELRAFGYKNPILLLTGKDSSDDRVMGLDAGADDYVVKPFDLPELLARIRALSRRLTNVSETLITWDKLQLNSTNSEVTCDGQRLHFTPKEYCLLELFFLNPNRVFSRSAILDKLWDFADSPGEETVSTHIKCLRQKLKAAGSPDPVETVHGLGYRLRQPSTANISTPLPSQPKSYVVSDRSDKIEVNRQKLRQKTAKIWEKHKNNLAHQVTVIERVTSALIASKLTSELREEAKHEAHKLAGSLGVFGLAEGSRLARELEHLLQSNVHIGTQEAHKIVELTKSLREELNNAGASQEREIKSTNYSPLVLVVDDDLVLAEQLRSEAITWGIRVEVACDLIVARKIIAKAPPDAILLDLNFPQPTEDGLCLLRELTNRVPKIPVIAFTGRESLADRVEVAQLGGCAFLRKPSSTPEILKAITEALSPKRNQIGNRVMVVDDDSMILEILSHQLGRLGVEVKTLSNSEYFWEVLCDFNPNLLILDMKMPNFDGVQLCQVVRIDQQWQHLPIIFLSAHTTAEEIDRAFAAGADDYISKSIDGQEIATRINRRLRRNA